MEDPESDSVDRQARRKSKRLSILRREPLADLVNELQGDVPPCSAVKLSKRQKKRVSFSETFSIKFFKDDARKACPVEPDTEGARDRKDSECSSEEVLGQPSHQVSAPSGDLADTFFHENFTSDFPRDCTNDVTFSQDFSKLLSQEPLIDTNSYASYASNLMTSNTPVPVKQCKPIVGLSPFKDILPSRDCSFNNSLTLQSVAACVSDSDDNQEYILNSLQLEEKRLSSRSASIPAEGLSGATKGIPEIVQDFSGDKTIDVTFSNELSMFIPPVDAPVPCTSHVLNLRTSTGTAAAARQCKPVSELSPFRDFSNSFSLTNSTACVAKLAVERNQMPMLNSLKAADDAGVVRSAFSASPEIPGFDQCFRTDDRSVNDSSECASSASSSLNESWGRLPETTTKCMNLTQGLSDGLDKLSVSGPSSDVAVACVSEVNRDTFTGLNGIAGTNDDDKKHGTGATMSRTPAFKIFSDKTSIHENKCESAAVSSNNISSCFAVDDDTKSRCSALITANSHPSVSVGKEALREVIDFPSGASEKLFIKTATEKPCIVGEKTAREHDSVDNKSSYYDAKLPVGGLIWSELPRKPLSVLHEVDEKGSFELAHSSVVKCSSYCGSESLEGDSCLGIKVNTEKTNEETAVATLSKDLGVLPLHLRSFTAAQRSSHESNIFQTKHNFSRSDRISSIADVWNEIDGVTCNVADKSETSICSHKQDGANDVSGLEFRAAKAAMKKGVDSTDSSLVEFRNTTIGRPPFKVFFDPTETRFIKAGNVDDTSARAGKRDDLFYSGGISNPAAPQIDHDFSTVPLSQLSHKKVAGSAFFAVRKTGYENQDVADMSEHRKVEYRGAFNVFDACSDKNRKPYTEVCDSSMQGSGNVKSDLNELLWEKLGGCDLPCTNSVETSKSLSISVPAENQAQVACPLSKLNAPKSYADLWSSGDDSSYFVGALDGQPSSNTSCTTYKPEDLEIECKVSKSLISHVTELAVLAKPASSTDLPGTTVTRTAPAQDCLPLSYAAFAPVPANGKVSLLGPLHGHDDLRKLATRENPTSLRLPFSEVRPCLSNNSLQNLPNVDAVVKRSESEVPSYNESTTSQIVAAAVGKPQHDRSRSGKTDGDTIKGLLTISSNESEMQVASAFKMTNQSSCKGLHTSEENPRSYLDMSSQKLTSNVNHRQENNLAKLTPAKCTYHQPNKSLPESYHLRAALGGKAVADKSVSEHSNTSKLESRQDDACIRVDSTTACSGDRVGFACDASVSSSQAKSIVQDEREQQAPFPSGIITYFDSECRRPGVASENTPYLSTASVPVVRGPAREEVRVERTDHAENILYEVKETLGTTKGRQSDEMNKTYVVERGSDIGRISTETTNDVVSLYEESIAKQPPQSQQNHRLAFSQPDLLGMPTRPVADVSKVCVSNLAQQPAELRSDLGLDAAHVPPNLSQLKFSGLLSSVADRPSVLNKTYSCENGVAFQSSNAGCAIRREDSSGRVRLVSTAKDGTTRTKTDHAPQLLATDTSIELEKVYICRERLDSCSAVSENRFGSADVHACQPFCCQEPCRDSEEVLSNAHHKVGHMNVKVANCKSRKSVGFSDTVIGGDLSPGERNWLDDSKSGLWSPTQARGNPVANSSFMVRRSIAHENVLDFDRESSVVELPQWVVPKDGSLSDQDLATKEVASAVASDRFERIDGGVHVVPLPSIGRESSLQCDLTSQESVNGRSLPTDFKVIVGHDPCDRIVTKTTADAEGKRVPLLELHSMTTHTDERSSIKSIFKPSGYVQTRADDTSEKTALQGLPALGPCGPPHLPLVTLERAAGQSMHCEGKSGGKGRLLSSVRQKCDLLIATNSRSEKALCGFEAAIPHFSERHSDLAETRSVTERVPEVLAPEILLCKQDSQDMKDVKMTELGRSVAGPARKGRLLMAVRQKCEDIAGLSKLEKPTCQPEHAPPKIAEVPVELVDSKSTPLYDHDGVEARKLQFRSPLDETAGPSIPPIAVADLPMVDVIAHVDSERTEKQPSSERSTKRNSSEFLAPDAVPDSVKRKMAQGDLLLQPRNKGRKKRQRLTPPDRRNCFGAVKAILRQKDSSSIWTVEEMTQKHVVVSVMNAKMFKIKLSFRGKLTHKLELLWNFGLVRRSERYCAEVMNRALNVEELLCQYKNVTSLNQLFDAVAARVIKWHGFSNDLRLTEYPPRPSILQLDSYEVEFITDTHTYSHFAVRFDWWFGVAPGLKISLFHKKLWNILEDAAKVVRRLPEGPLLIQRIVEALVAFCKDVCSGRIRIPMLGTDSRATFIDLHDLALKYVY